METILGEGSGASGEEQAVLKASGVRGAEQETGSLTGGGAVSWGEYPGRVGITFNLSKQVGTELDKLRLELELEEDIRPSKSEIAEEALRIAVEDARAKGKDSELVKRLIGLQAIPSMSTTGRGALKVQRSVDDTGFIVETTYDENGEIVDEDLVANVAELPVEAEYLDEKGRLVSLAKDELGNTFEQIMDEQFNTLDTRLVEAKE